MIESEEEKHYANAEVIRKKIYSMYKEMVDSIRFVLFSIERSINIANVCFLATRILSQFKMKSRRRQAKTLR